MKKRTLFVCENPHLAKHISSIMNTTDKVIIASGTLSYKFDYKNVNYSQSPYTKEEPQYKFNPTIMSPIFHYGIWDNHGNQSENIELKSYFELIQKDFYDKKESFKHLSNFFSNFNEIVYACNLNWSGYRAFDFKFKKYFKLGKNWIDFFENKNIKISGMSILSYDKNTLIEEYKKRKILNNSNLFRYLKEDYMKKDFFEYNYNLNSLLFFNEALNEAGYIKDENCTILTKNYILSLFLLLEEDNLFENVLINKMAKKNIGTDISRPLILENLIKMNLVKYNIKIKKNIHSLILTEVGEKFLKLLHNKVNDKYLSIRLQKDRCDLSTYINKNSKDKAEFISINEFINKYEKYLYNTFSKQKRFLRKIKRNS